MPLLEVKNLTKNFGGLAAVSDVNMYVDEHELIGLIGPNGAGKTTIFNLLTGTYVPTEGKVSFSPDGTPKLLNNKKPYVIARMGVSRTFQNIRLFKELTVQDNVLVAMSSQYKEPFIPTILRLPSFYKTEETMREKAIDLLRIFGLEGKLDSLAKNLPYGEQRKLEIVRALATNPKLMYLDEPAAGMNPQETAELTQLIRKIHTEFNITIILIEHDMSLVMDICERIYVLEYGRVIAEGNPESIKNNPRVIQAYLGGELEC